MDLPFEDDPPVLTHLLVVPRTIPLSYRRGETSLHDAEGRSSTMLLDSPVSSKLAIVLPAIALGYRFIGTGLHYADGRISTLLPFRRQPSILAHLLVVLGAVAFGPCWTVTTGGSTHPVS